MLNSNISAISEMLSSYTTYYGRAQAVIRVTGKEVKVIVESEKYGKKEAIFR